MTSRMTPIIIKDRADIGWLEDERVFYVLGRNGLFICRNHEFFQSCARARDCPAELERHETFLVPRYPRLSQRQFERIVGFFAEIGDTHDAEAAALLAWDRQEERVRIVIPEQVATIGRGWSGRGYPIGLHYKNPSDLPPHWFLFGDVHSHVDLPAYASSIDRHDELHAAGLHIVVGRLQFEPPDFHVEAVVDGERFRLDLPTVVGGYERRCLDVPKEWIEKVTIEEEGWSNSRHGAQGSRTWTSSGAGTAHRAGDGDRHGWTGGSR